MAKRIVGVLRGWDEGLSLFAILGRMANYQHISHGFEPVFDEHSRILVLGSFPSVLSRENAFYYGNPQNRFWRVMAACLGEPVPQNEGGLSDNGRPLTLEESIAAKKQMLLEHGIALWDVIASCDIKGSSDASIKNVVPAQVERILEEAHIGAVICNGGTAGRLYKRYLQWQVGLAAHVLPSTSPANAAWQLERLTARWQEELLPLLEAAETGALGEVPSPSSVKRGFVTAKTQVAKRSSVNGADGGHASDPRDDTAANANEADSKHQAAPRVMPQPGRRRLRQPTAQRKAHLHGRWQIRRQPPARYPEQQAKAASKSSPYASLPQPHRIMQCTKACRATSGRTRSPSCWCASACGKRG